MNRAWAWASHVPLIQAVMSVCKPASVFEAGIGLHSTPLFDVPDVKYVGVENDEAWINKLRKKDRTLIHHKLPNGITKDTKYWDYPMPIQYETIGFYQRVFEEELQGKDLLPSLLFVDGYAGTRKMVLQTLLNKFNLIVFHDSNENYLYGYSEIDYAEYVRYELTCNTSSTAFLIRKELLTPTFFYNFSKQVYKNVREFNKTWKMSDATSSFVLINHERL